MIKLRNEILKVFLLATFIALLVRAFIIENYRISSESMLPTYPKNRWVFVNKLAYNIRIPFSTFEIAHISDPTYDEVVAFTLPNRGRETFIKRVVGLSGDRIAIKQGKLFVNDVPVTPNYPVLSMESSKDYGPIVVPKNHFFALGDNRSESIDSRVWGPIPISYLKGRL